MPGNSVYAIAVAEFHYPDGVLLPGERAKLPLTVLAEGVRRGVLVAIKPEPDPEPTPVVPTPTKIEE